MGMLPEGRRARILEEVARLGMARVTDLAQRLGVSPVTIRRDLNELVDDGALRRVHGGVVAVAAVRGEEPETQPGRHVTIGMLVPSLDYYWPGIVEGAQVEAGARGLGLVLRGTAYGAGDVRAEVERLLEGGADALLLAPDVDAGATSELLGWLAERGIPAVLVEREGRLPSGRCPAESVTSDHAGGAEAAVAHLLAAGHRRIGLIAHSGSPHAAAITEGWREALTTAGLVAVGWELPLDRSRPAPVAEAVESALAQGLTALLVHADREAMAVAQILESHGVQVPRDLSIVAYDDEVAGLFDPPLTAVRPPRESIGRAAVALLAERMADPDRPAHRVVISPRLTIRESVAAPRDAQGQTNGHT